MAKNKTSAKYTVASNPVKMSKKNVNKPMVIGYVTSVPTIGISIESTPLGGSKVQEEVNSKPVETAQQAIRREAKEFQDQIKAETKYKVIAIKRHPKFPQVCRIVVSNADLKRWLADNGIEAARNKMAEIEPNDLLPIISQIESHNNHPLFKELNLFIQFHMKNEIHAINELMSKNLIQYNYLWFVYTVGKEVYTIQDNEISAGKVISAEFVNGWMPHISISVEQIYSDGQTFQKRVNEFEQRPFKGELPLDGLNVKLLTPELKETLTKRGLKFQKYALGNNYLQYSGAAKVPKEWYGHSYFKSDGRIIIDSHNYDKNNTKHHREDENGEKMKDIPVEYLPFHYPYLKGFSFSLKKWGEFSVEGMTDIQFRDDAFETLVLDSDKKSLISSIVQTNKGFTDIIDGKSGGVIICLSGPPGTGKTLTAEALAEKMHKPLYSVSVGELGISPEELETKLREILSISEAWDAVILIDEADIFLQARNDQDIVRNAMVGIFLRLLEYHSGVMFLTTNRAHNLDQAFHSRISLSFHYQAHGKHNRKNIWDNLLNKAEIKGIDTTKLADYDINGRQIKTTIRLAQALAADRKESISIDHMKLILTIQEQFLKDVKGK